MTFDEQSELYALIAAYLEQVRADLLEALPERIATLDISDFSALTPEQILGRLYCLGLSDFATAFDPAVPLAALSEADSRLN